MLFPGSRLVRAKRTSANARIRGGSVGKWGSVPMPPFAALKPEEVKAMAAFVLKQ